MNLRNTSVNTRSDCAWPGGHVRSDVGGLGVASGTQLDMNVNEIILTVATFKCQHKIFGGRRSRALRRIARSVWINPAGVARMLTRLL